MTPELQKYYENRFSTMGTDGWLDLMEDMFSLQMQSLMEKNSLLLIEMLHIYQHGIQKIQILLKGILTNLLNKENRGYDKIKMAAV